MAESYLIAIKFVADNSTTKQTEKKLNSVFDRVTKRFKNGISKVGNTLKTVFTAGGVFTGIAMVLTRLLAPLSELNDRINATLTRARDIKTRAQGYGTDVKTYTALEGYANSVGIRPEVFNMMMSKLQSGIAGASSGEKNALQAYSGETNTAKAMFNLMNAISAETDVNKRTRIVTSIFGERAMAQLQPLITGGFGGLKEFTKGLDFNSYEKAIDKLADRENQQSQLAFARDIKDMIAKGNIITEKVIKDQDKNAQARLDFENNQIKAYASIAKLDTQLLSIQKTLLDISYKFGLVTKPLEGLEMLGKLGQDMTSDPKSHLAVIARGISSFVMAPSNAGAWVAKKALEKLK